MTQRNYHTNHIVEELHDYCIDYEGREIFLHGSVDSIDEEPGTDWRMSSTFIKNLRLLDDGSNANIIIHQNNPGGCWNNGMAIYDAIASCDCYVILVMHGVAASMGSIIPQAADLRLSMPNSEIMVHAGYTGVANFTHTKAQSWAKYEQELFNIMLNIYADRCGVGSEFKGKTRTQIKNTIRTKMKSAEDWFLLAKQAVEYGFTDGIIGDKYELNDLATLQL